MYIEKLPCVDLCPMMYFWCFTQDYSIKSPNRFLSVLSNFPATGKMSGLTEEQRRRMEENKRRALAKRAEAKAQSGQNTGAPSTSLIRPVSSSVPQNTGAASTSLIRPVSSSVPQNRFPSGGGYNNRPAPGINQAFDEAGKSSAKTKGSCGLISKTRFEVNVIYHGKLI